MDLHSDRITSALAAGGLLTRALAAFAAVAALALTAACGGGGGGGEGGGGSTATPDPQVRASIGAAGGDVAFADQRFKLTIPAGALANPTEIVITEVSAANVPQRLQPLAADRVWRLEPDGLQFAQPVTAQAVLPGGNRAALMLLDANGTTEVAAAMRARVGADQRLVSGQLTHFSHVLVKVQEVTLELTLDKTELEVGESLRADILLTSSNRQDFVDEGCFVLPAGSVLRQTNLPRCIHSTLELDDGKFSDSINFICDRPGNDTIVAQLEVVTSFSLIFIDRLFLPIEARLDVRCKGRTGSIVPTGVRPVPNLTAPDVAHVIRRTFGPFGQGGTAGVNGSSRAGPLASNPIDASSGALAVVAGAEGTVVVDLVSGQLLLDWTTSGPDRDVLGSPTIGVLPITRPGANAPAALFGYRVNGSALRNHDPTMNAFGLTAIGQSPVFDATTVGGDAVADAFISVSPARGIEFYGFDEAAQFYRGAFAPSLSASLFPGGTLLTAYRVAAGSAVLAATRGHDGNTTSRLWAHSGSGTQAATPIATLAAEARRVRCLAPESATPASPHLCGVTSASGSVAFFAFDPANALMPVTPLVVPTASGTLGIALGRRANGNPYAVVANLTSDSLNLIELTPALGLVSITPIAAPAGCTRPAHPALLTDSEGDKAVVSCNGSASLWILRLFPRA